ncbi:hypothetical protein [Methanobrevibacter sp.]|uniref:hypothetical protein n=1 Tax=Methanobrevibacter sp. TaxID=66852 RepID=UPI003D7D0E21
MKQVIKNAIKCGMVEFDAKNQIYWLCHNDKDEDDIEALLMTIHNYVKLIYNQFECIGFKM